MNAFKRLQELEKEQKELLSKAELIDRLGDRAGCLFLGADGIVYFALDSTYTRTHRVSLETMDSWVKQAKELLG